MFFHEVNFNRWFSDEKPAKNCELLPFANKYDAYKIVITAITAWIPY